MDKLESNINGIEQAINTLNNGSDKLLINETPKQEIKIFDKIKNAKSFLSNNVFVFVTMIFVFFVFTTITLITARPNFITYNKIDKKTGQVKNKISIAKIINTIIVLTLFFAIFYFIYSAYGDEMTKYFSKHYYDRFNTK